MLRKAIVLILFIPQLLYSQTSDPAFQILVAKDAFIFGRAAEPLTLVDDVTSIDVKPGGFLALVHKGGTTYEHTEKVFTFYLKPQKLKELNRRPNLDILYKDKASSDSTDSIVILYPQFNSDKTVIWRDNTPFEIFWHLPDEPVIAYKLTIRDHTGKKIQDYGTKKHSFVLKPYNFGLDEKEFIFQVSSTFAGETTRSSEYTIKLQDGPQYPKKASDLVLQAANLDLSPMSALEVWKQILGMENGKYYFELFEKFITRNKALLTESGEDVELLLSQNK
ncbi:MAG: hypothetical protein ABJG78_09140 [Cyclobacteriaceae bacterium]